MTNTKNGKGNVKQNKPSHNLHAHSREKNFRCKKTGESKQATMINLLRCPHGTTMDEMAKVTGWQQHSIRGLISGVLKKRLGLSIISEKKEHGRNYRIGA